MIELLSYGNQLRSGKYKMHSKFSSAVNFVSGETFVFVVNEYVGPGPLNIVVKGIVPQYVDSLEIEDSCFHLNGSEIGFDNEKRYDPFISLNDFNYETFIHNLSIVKNILIDKSSPQSLSRVVNDYSPPALNEDSSFEKEYRRRIEAGVNQVLYGDVIAGVKMIRGLGPGLTPSGDDFNAGLLIALNLIQKICTDPTHQTKELIYQVHTAAKGNNPFTNSFLNCASRGLLFYKFRELIKSLLSSDINNVIQKTELVLSVGETSGADQLTGFLIGMKRFLI
jgi:hypothetical protein